MNVYNKDEQKILRDYLALDRTYLANERTFLAYIRTFIGFAGAGAGMTKLMGGLWVHLGYVLFSVSPVFLIIGIIHFFIIKKKLGTLDR